MKKMLAKAVALSLVMGGIGFVANDAQAAKITDGVKVFSGKKVEFPGIRGCDVKTENELEKDTALANQNDLKAVNDDVEAAKTNIANNKDNIDKNAKDIAAEVKARKDADKALSDRIDTNVEAITANKTAIEQEVADRKKAVENEAKAREDADKVLEGKIADEATTRANEDKRIEAKFDGEVARLDSKIDKLDARVEKVGAMAAAIANLHTMGYDPEAPTEIAVGVGQYRDKTGMALGAFHYPNRDFMLSFSVSTAGDEYMGGIGATWKFGRKTPEELRQAEAEKAAKAKLAKAEAAKKAAKDARVAAQQKRHAEMLAARTAK